MKRKGRIVLLITAAVFFALLFLLTRLERGAAAATIRSFSDALWFAMTTLTTVGYGDLYPVTAAGRLIGVVLELLSLGALVFLFTVIFSSLREAILPRIRLFFAREQDWYCFSSRSAAAEALASAVAAQGGGRALPIFYGQEGTSTVKDAFLCVPFQAEELIRRRGERGRISFFCMDESSQKNEAAARALAEKGVRVYCLSEHETEHSPAGLVFFDPHEACARLYWQRFPILSPTERVVLIGEGKNAEALLEQALLVNVLDPAQKIRYRVYGDWEEFSLNHPQLRRFCGEEESKGDCLIFAAQPWRAEAEELQQAERVIVCFDDEEKTLRELTALRRYFPVSAAVHAKLSVPFDGVQRFGGTEEIFSPALVMREKLSRLARYLHETYRASVSDAPAWEELGSFTRRSNLAAADHLAVKLRILLGDEGTDASDTERCEKAAALFEATDGAARERLRRIEHERWSRFHWMNNWSYDEHRDNARRRHPLLRPFDELSEEEQAKDDFSWQMIRLLCKPDGKDRT